MSEMYLEYYKPKGKVYYCISIEDSNFAGSWYPQQLSINAILRRINKRYLQTRFKNSTIGLSSAYDYRMHQKDNRTEIYYFKSTWEFYSVIGYEHKNKSVKAIDKVCLEWDNIHLKVKDYFSNKDKGI